MRPFALYLLLFVFMVLTIGVAPISNDHLSRDLDEVLDTIQAERKDQIEYIDHYKLVQDKAPDEKSSDKIFIDIRFFIKTRRGAKENFLLRVNYIKKDDLWKYSTFKILDSIQTTAPVLRPAKIQVPNKQLVFSLVKARLKKDSLRDQKYSLHAIKKDGASRFEWGENYTRTRFVYLLESKIIERDYNNYIKEYYLCNWKTLIEYNEKQKKWVLIKIHKPAKKNNVTQGCKVLKQNFQEKMDNIFPGELEK